MKKVQILLSTYNANLNYLVQQIDSLLAQTYPVDILVRDDGSTNETVEILKQYRDRYRNFLYYEGENIGAIQSFFDLIKHADIESDYVAFCDQDDVWMPDKISAAIKSVEEYETFLVAKDMDMSASDRCPILYCSAQTLVNQDLEPISSNIRKKGIRPGFGNALIENICTGCTALINKTLLRMLLVDCPGYTIMHDWWMYLVASCFGKVIYDENSYIMYRQHGDNVMGIETDFAHETATRAKKFKKRKNNISHQAYAFGKCYKDQMSSENKKLVIQVAEYHKRLKYHFTLAFHKGVYRQRKIDHFIYKILFLFGLR